MKAITLKRILNTTRPTADYGNYVAVGSSLCHDLIRVDKQTMQVSYALDTFREGKKSVTNDELLAIWNKLEELISTGELNAIIAGSDTTEKPIPVYSFDEDKGEIVQSFCEEAGYPNTTLDGQMMYENTHFISYAKTVKTAIENTELEIKHYDELVAEKELQLGELKRKAKRSVELLEYLVRAGYKKNFVKKQNAGLVGLKVY